MLCIVAVHLFPAGWSVHLPYCKNCSTQFIVYFSLGGWKESRTLLVLFCSMNTNSDRKSNFEWKCMFPELTLWPVLCFGNAVLSSLWGYLWPAAVTPHKPQCSEEAEEPQGRLKHWWQTSFCPHWSANSPKYPSCKTPVWLFCQTATTLLTRPSLSTIIPLLKEYSLLFAVHMLFLVFWAMLVAG